MTALYILAALGIVGIADVLFFKGQIGVILSGWLRSLFADTE